MELVVSLIVVVIAQGVTLWVTRSTLKQQAEQGEKQRQETRRAEWKQYLTRLMEHLINVRRDYEQFLCTDKSDVSRHGAIIGMAIAVCLAGNDNILSICVVGNKSERIDGLTPYFVAKGEDGALEDWESRNRKAIQMAVTRLAVMIESA